MPSSQMRRLRLREFDLHNGPKAEVGQGFKPRSETSKPMVLPATPLYSCIPQTMVIDACSQPNPGTHH